MRLHGMALVLGLCLACKASPQSVPAPDASVARADSAPGPTPGDELDRLDQRRAVPLLPMMAQHQKQNMREHLEAVQEVVAAASVSDFDRVASAAKRLGYSDAMGRMCEHMGAGAPGFTEQAIAFHHTADEIAAAAVRRDSAGVLSSLSKTLAACTACHASFKQRLVASLPP